ncbi:hypothetical protein [Streptomyces sp. NPDC058623]|uniref:hypothetical protein n=1 Tax=Streptomyces sp. NPDC058623 TaxID=3346563 RepID=UPI003654F744
MTNALLINTLIPLPQFATSGNDVTWPLTCELLFYLLFPRLIPLISRLHRKQLLAAAAGAVAAAWTVPLVSLRPGGQPLAHGLLGGELTDLPIGFVYAFPPSRLTEFILGMVLARLHATGYTPRIGVLPALRCSAHAC